MKPSVVKLLANLIFFSLFTVMGCKKYSNTEKDNLLNPQLIQDFFKVSMITDLEVSKIAKDWNKQKGFKEQLGAFVKKNGYPVWEKAFVQMNNNTSKIKGKVEGESATSSKGVIFIPLKDPDNTEIKSYVVCNKHSDSVYSYRLYNKEDISNIDANNNDSLDRARNITLSMFAYFEKVINNKENTYFGGKTKQTINKIKITAKLQPNNTGNKGQRINNSFCGTSWTFTTVQVYTDATTGATVVQTNNVTVFVMCAELISGWDAGNVGLPGNLPGGMPGTGDIFVFTGGGSGGTGGASGTSSMNGWWNYGSGYNGIYIGGTYTDPYNLYPFWNGPVEAVSYTDEQLMLQNLSVQLNLSVEEQWFLLSNLNMTGALHDYFINGSQLWNDRVAILKEHISALVSNFEYSIFVQNYTLNDNTGKIWWENDDWLNSNFSFVSDCPLGWCNLTQAERNFIKAFPFSAFSIKINADVAKSETRQMFNIAPNEAMPPNDKSNAFLHAFWCAMNLHSVGEEKARLFAAAHETETPLQLQMETTMDLFNNEVGFNIAKTQSSLFSNHVYQSLISGQLRYLKPVNYLDPAFWGGNNVPETHGITGLTQIVPTNQ